MKGGLPPGYRFASPTNNTTNKIILASNHLQNLLQEYEIPRLKTIHYARDLASLKKKVHQQHQYNCWQDSASAIFFQSDHLSTSMWDSIINPILTILIDQYDGDITKLYSDSFIFHVATNLQAEFHLSSPPYMFVYIVCRYIQKLFQIYEEDYGIEHSQVCMRVPDQVVEEFALGSDTAVAQQPHPTALQMASSVNVTAEHALQSRLRQPGSVGGRIREIIGADQIIPQLNPTSSILTSFSYNILAKSGRAPSPSTAYGYYFSVVWPDGTSGHVISLFKKGDLWYLYDNSNSELVYEFSLDNSNAITNYGIQTIFLSRNDYSLDLSYTIILGNGLQDTLTFGTQPLHLLPGFVRQHTITTSLKVSDYDTVMFSTAIILLPTTPTFAMGRPPKTKRKPRSKPKPAYRGPPAGVPMNLDGGRRQRTISRKRTIRRKSRVRR